MELMNIVAILAVFGIPLSAIWTSHQRKMLELQLQNRNQSDSSVQASVEALREEVRALRDTTMQYDLSFDTALQRMENRVENLERRVGEAAETTNAATLRAGR